MYTEQQISQGQGLARNALDTIIIHQENRSVQGKERQRLKQKS